jgi:hypothetical protein
MFEILLITKAFTAGFFSGLMMPHVKAKPLQHWEMTVTKKEKH